MLTRAWGGGREGVEDVQCHVYGVKCIMYVYNMLITWSRVYKRDCTKRLAYSFLCHTVHTLIQALYYASMFLWLCGRHDKAREYVDRMLKMSPSSKDGLTLRGWIDLTSGRETFVKRSSKYFDESLAGLA